jgi:hypothetical protein
MTARRPLVQIDGRTRQLPADDTIASGGVFPFFKADGTASPISLTSDEKLPFFKADGTASNIALTV